MNKTITGSNDGIFDEFEFSLDPQIYAIDSLDIINPISLARACLMVDSTKIAGIRNEMGHPINSGRLLYFSFQFEIIESS